MSCTKAIKLEYVTIFANHRKHGGLGQTACMICAHLLVASLLLLSS